MKLTVAGRGKTQQGAQYEKRYYKYNCDVTDNISGNCTGGQASL